MSKTQIPTGGIADDAISEEHIDATVITGSTALGATPADTDELLISDAGTIKRVDYSYLKDGAGLVLTGSSVSSTAASAITITNCFSSTYQNYLLTGSMIPSTDGSTLRFRLHDGSNALTASSYKYATFQTRMDSGGYASATGGNDGADHVQLTSGNNNDISNAASTRMFIFSPAVADYRTNALMDTIGYTSSNDLDRNVQHMKYNTAHTALGVTFYTSSGNIDEFDIRVYGMVNS
jgi:hypothetical protein